MEPTPPELGAGTGSPHELVIEGREELLYLLGEAAELEHSVCCSYLYAAFTLQADPGEGLTAAQLPVVAGWKRTINEIALQEMIHLVLVNNLLAALGGGAVSAATTFPALPLRARDPTDPCPFSEQTLQPFLHIERPEGLDISTMAGALEEPLSPPPALTGPLVLPAPQALPASGSCTTESSGAARPGQPLRGGASLRRLTERAGLGAVLPRPRAHAGADPVTGLASAAQAIQTIVEEGEGARGSWQGAHFGRFLTMLEAYRVLKAADPSFAPARPAVANPYVRVPRDLLGVAAATQPAGPEDPFTVHLIQDRCTAAVSDLFNACYAALLQLLYREDRRAELHAHQRHSGDPAQAGSLAHPRRTAAGAGRGVRRPDRGRSGGAVRSPLAAGHVRGAAGNAWRRRPGATSRRPGPSGPGTRRRRPHPEFRAGRPAAVHRTGPGRHALGVRPWGGRVGAAAREAIWNKSPLAACHVTPPGPPSRSRCPADGYRPAARTRSRVFLEDGQGDAC